MRNKLSFDLQLSARKAAIAERITAHKIARSKVSVFLMAMSAGVFMAQPVHLVGNDGDGKKSGRY
ncbi:formate transporter [Shigella sonnei]|nr:formate transporter [Shigella sonnei]